MNKNNNTPNILYAAVRVVNIYEAVLGVMFLCSPAPCSPPKRLARARMAKKLRGKLGGGGARAHSSCYLSSAARAAARAAADKYLAQKALLKGLVGVL